MPFTILRQDITKIKADAIVNAANNDLAMGGGVCGAIFGAAGYAELLEACRKVSPVQTGNAVITPGFKLSAKYIIHAVGPVYDRHNAEMCRHQLRSAYTKSLELAADNGCGSIAFPLISSGIYGYPKEEALNIAVSAIKDFLVTHDMDIYLAIFDSDSFIVSEKLLGAVESYIDENYVDTHFISRKEAINKNFSRSLRQCFDSIAPMAEVRALDDIIEDLDEPFNITLLKLIDAKGKTDTEVYKRANIDRKLFSKIRTGNGYMPSKRTILALSVALELNLDETDDLLKRAGYSLSHSQKFDVIVEFFIVNGKYDIYEINEVLFKYDQPLLGTI